MSKHRSQNGFISIMVSLIIMAVLTLIVTGFAALMRREQRQAVDRQLSTAAFYAAESGVNDAIDSLINNPSQPDITTCTNPPLAGYNNTLDADGLIKYTCVLTDATPTSLEKTNVSDKESSILPIDTNGTPIRSLQISWESSDTAYRGQFSNTLAFPQSGATPGFINTGMLRLTTIPYGGSVSRSTIRSNARTFFLFPRAGSGTPLTVAYGTDATSGRYGPGECQANDTPRECNVIINITGDPTRMYLRLKAIYRSVAVSVRAYTQSGALGPELELHGSQHVIDVTGKANNVLRRIQVRKPVENSFKYPEFALESVDTICKRMIIWRGGTDIDVGGLPGDTSACQLN